MVTEQKCSLPANLAERGYISVISVTDEGIAFEVWVLSLCFFRLSVLLAFCRADEGQLWCTAILYSSPIAKHGVK